MTDMRFSEQVEWDEDKLWTVEKAQRLEAITPLLGKVWVNDAWLIAPPAHAKSYWLQNTWNPTWEPTQPRWSMDDYDWESRFWDMTPDQITDLYLVQQDHPSPDMVPEALESEI